MDRGRLDCHHPIEKETTDMTPLNRSLRKSPLLVSVVAPALVFALASRAAEVACAR